MTHLITALVGISVLVLSRGDFFTETKDVLDKANTTLKIGLCIDKARRLVSSKGERYNWTKEEKAAVTLVNLYTQNCKVNNERNEKLYSLLNARLSDRPVSPNGFNYAEFGNLLNRALDILHRKYGVDNKQLYRGQCDTANPCERTYRPLRFFSTSINPTSAFNKTCFIIINDASGLSVKDFSDVPKENEVLIKYTATYQIRKNTTNPSEINETFRQLGVTYPYKRLIVLKQIQKRPRNVRGVTGLLCTSRASAMNSLVIHFIAVLWVLLSRCP